jgi:chromosome segregation ATPase
MRRTANAVAAEPDDVPVISNEVLEANVVFIRETIARLESESKAAVVRVDEQFREVRQDIREFRADNKTLREKIDATQASLSAKIDGNCSSLDQKISVTHASLSAKIDGIHSSLDKKIDIQGSELRADMKEIRGDISDLKAMQKAIAWFVGSVAIVAALVNIAKTLNWI